MPNNDLFDFINSASNKMDEEYNRIQKRVRSNPSTAGDQGEENWATILRDWLPPIFQIVTKGHIIDSKGNASPQVDVLVLKPEYPKGLLDKKLYLAGGVLAAFECKVTLKSKDLKKFFKTSMQIKTMLPSPDYNSIYDEVQSPIYFGLLAHSHNWKMNAKTIATIGENIFRNDIEFLTRPIQIPDIVCVANTGCWVATKFLAPQVDINKTPPVPSIFTAYICEQDDTIEPVATRPIGTALKAMMLKMSKEHTGLNSLARYFQRTLRESGGGPGRYWAIEDTFPPHLRKQFKKIGTHPNYYFPEDWKYLR